MDLGRKVNPGLNLRLKHGLVRRSGEDVKLVVSKEIAGNIAFAQLNGMKDDLTKYIVSSITAEGSIPLVVKSTSYGNFKEYLPFLVRPNIESKAIFEGRECSVKCSKIPCI
ncbi:unnamed protein product [Fusarium venenatum]|uniref:Uncharacterized protein n=1 Tax=Fusarium venenatum TaxID=56646 RepID=A0A2L2TUZ3_9HYPO|nr:uncharacterized protein FVRRES_08153 [Fusarium venenatum]CEI68076.1 unnamed protein product [Fusarium venenatum]